MKEINFELFDDEGNFRQQLEMPTPMFKEGYVFIWELDEDIYLLMMPDESEHEEMLEFIANFI